MRALLFFLCGIALVSNTIEANESQPDLIEVTPPTKNPLPAPPFEAPPPSKPSVTYNDDMSINLGTTKIGLYGFLKADYLADWKIAGNTADVRPSFVPLSNDPATQHFQSIIDARDSRLGFKIEDVWRDMKMKGVIEADFFTQDGDAISTNSRHFRLRLAYASAELSSHFFFLTGQFYTLPMHMPEIEMPTRVNMIFQPPGTINARTPQFRLGYKKVFSEKRLLQFEVDAEAQGFNQVGAVAASGASISQGSGQKMPLFGAKAMFLSEMFKWNVGAAASRIYCITNGVGFETNTNVWGLFTSAAWYWKDLLVWITGHHTAGLARLSSGVLESITLVNNNTDLVAAKTTGGAVAVRYDFIKGAFWTDLIFGVDNAQGISNSLFSGSEQKIYKDFRANLIGAFGKHWQVGVEFEKLWVEAFNHSQGNNTSIHLGVIYQFGKS